MVLVLRIELFGLLSQLIDGDLPDNEREVFSLGIVDCVLLVGRSGDMCLVRKFELSLHVVEVLLILLYSFLLVFVVFLA